MLCGGERVDGPGHFYKPTVLADVPADARLLKEEIFGPVAPITTFGTEDEAIAAANDTEFGLVAYLYTADLKRALRVCERLETGMVGAQPGHRLQRRRAVRRRQAVGHRPRGRPGGHRGVPRDEVRGDRFGLRSYSPDAAPGVSANALQPGDRVRLRK